MKDFGFVYLLANRAMPNIYKVGCTQNSPHSRAAQLSNETSCPLPFDVVCFWEGQRYYEFEQELHSVFDEVRVSQNREFFYGPLKWLVNCMDSWEEYKCGFYITKVGEWYLRWGVDIDLFDKALEETVNDSNSSTQELLQAPENANAA